MTAHEEPTSARDALRRALAARRPSPGREAELVSVSIRVGSELLGWLRVPPRVAAALATRRHRLELVTERGYLVEVEVVDVPAEPEVRPAARRSDPSTSARAAELALPTARSTALAILRVLDADEARPGSYLPGRTADELEARLGRPCWRRLSEFTRLGLIEPVVDEAKLLPVERPGRSGRAQVAHRITVKGRAYVQELRDRVD